MSTSYSALMILGYRYEMRDKLEEITRYNEKTGKPYQTTQKNGLSIFINDIHWKDAPYDDHDDYLAGEYDKDGLEVHGAGYCGEHSEYIGTLCCEVDDSTPVADATIEMPRSPAFKEFEDLVGEPPKVYLLQRAG